MPVSWHRWLNLGLILWQVLTNFQPVYLPSWLSEPTCVRDSLGKACDR